MKAESWRSGNGWHAKRMWSLLLFVLYLYSHSSFSFQCAKIPFWWTRIHITLVFKENSVLRLLAWIPPATPVSTFLSNYDSEKSSNRKFITVKYGHRLLSCSSEGDSSYTGDRRLFLCIDMCECVSGCVGQGDASCSLNILAGNISDAFPFLFHHSLCADFPLGHFVFFHSLKGREMIETGFFFPLWGFLAGCGCNLGQGEKTSGSDTLFTSSHGRRYLARGISFPLLRWAQRDVSQTPQLLIDTMSILGVSVVKSALAAEYSKSLQYILYKGQRVFTAYSAEQFAASPLVRDAYRIR